MAVNIVQGYIFRLVARLGIAANVPTLQTGEMGWDTDKKVFRVGDNTSLPPRIMSDKSAGEFNFTTVTKVTFGEVAIQANKKVDGVDLKTINQADGFVARISAGTYQNRSLVSGDNSLSITNPAGVAGNPDLRLSASMITQLTPPAYYVQIGAPSSSKKSDFWQDTDEGIGERVYIRGFQGDGVTPKWIQISNDYIQASESDIGIVQLATALETQARNIATKAVHPRGLIGLIGAGIDFRAVKNVSLTTPPVGPSVGDAYLVAFAATGAWSGQAGKIATWDGNAWVFEQVRLGAILVNSNLPINDPARFMQQTSALTWENFNATSTKFGLTRVASNAELLAATTAGISAPALETALLTRNQNLNWLGVAGGSAATMTFTISPAPANYAAIANAPFRITTSVANADNPKFNANALGVLDVVWANGSNIQANAWGPGALLELIYDGTKMRVLSGASAAAQPPNRFVDTVQGTRTYTPSVTGWHRIDLYGGAGGGGGGQTSASPGSVAPGAGGGGGSGGHAVDWVFLIKDTPYTYTIGAAGGGGAIASNGAPGGNSSFVGPAGTIIAEGGAAGGGAASPGSGLGGSGGSGSGVSPRGYVEQGQGGYQGSPQIGQSGQGGSAVGGGAGGQASFGGGNPGTVPGGGGSGSVTSAAAGGNGAQGRLVIEFTGG